MALGSLLSSHSKLKVIVLTRNQRFLAALERNHSKIKQGGRASSEKKVAKLKERSSNIEFDKDRLELLTWITEIQRNLGWNDEVFAASIPVSKKTVQNWRNKVGYLPSIKNFKRLLELEKLTRASITILKNKNYFIKEQATIRVVIR